jgi:hypothetical protein
MLSSYNSFIAFNSKLSKEIGRGSDMWAPYEEEELSEPSEAEGEGDEEREPRRETGFFLHLMNGGKYVAQIAGFKAIFDMQGECVKALGYQDNDYANITPYDDTSIIGSRQTPNGDKTQIYTMDLKTGKTSKKGEFTGN